VQTKGPLADRNALKHGSANFPAAQTGQMTATLVSSRSELGGAHAPSAFVESVGCSEMDPMTDERIARNDSIFRDANEQINAKARDHDTDERQAVPFICECADDHCATLIPLSLGEYEDVRKDSRQFVTAFGHERFEGLAEIVSTNHNHLVVRKTGHAGDIAASLDQRHDGNGRG
jgi:hypothetical protein